MQNKALSDKYMLKDAYMCYFYRCWDKITDNIFLSVFVSTFKGTVRHSEEALVPGVWSSWQDFVPGQEAEWNERCCLLIFIQSGISAWRWWCPRIARVFLAQVSLPEHSHECRVVLPWGVLNPAAWLWRLSITMLTFGATNWNFQIGQELERRLAGKALAGQAWGPGFDPQHLCKCQA